MKNLIFVFATLVTVVFANYAQAEQLELPFKSADEVLLAAYPGDANTRYINNISSLPSKIVKTLAEVDLPFEMGDGYYGFVAGATYEVTDEAGNVVGYLRAELLSYSEDPEYHLGAAYINLKGKRLEQDPFLDTIERGDIEDLKRLPSELQPPAGDDE